MLKGAIRVPISGRLLLQALHLEDELYHYIIDAKMVEDEFNTIEITITGDDFPEVEENKQPIKVIPIITHIHEEFKVDWNIPK